MIPVRRWSLRARIMLVGTVPVLLAALLITGYHMVQRWGELKRETDTLANIALENISASAEYPLFSGNFDVLAPLIDATLRQSALAAVAVLDHAGEPVYLRRTERYGEIPASDIRIVQTEIVQDAPALDMFGDFDHSSPTTQTIGYVRLEVTDTFIRQRQHAILTQSLMVGLGVVLLAMIVAGTISTTIIPPLERLTGFIHRLASGDLSERAIVDNGAEIGKLQMGANQLAESLQQAQISQSRYNAELRMEQQKSVQASQAKSEFLSLMSHELRTPMNGANGMLQLISRDNSPEDFEEYKQMAQDSLNHLAQLLEDVLIVVDTEKNNLPVTFEEQNVPDELSSLIQELSERAMTEGLSFVVEFDEMLQRNKVRIDPSLLRQLIRHVADNAIKFTDQGYVVIRLSMHPQLDHHWMTIQVIDTGIGIPLDKRQKVMEAFSQVSSSFSRQYEGMGLGLTIAQHICHVLGGGIQLKDNQDGGTEVVLNLPVKVVDTSLADENPPLPEEPLRLLIVEDNPVNLKVAEKMLMKAVPKALISTAECGNKCLDLVSEQQFDLILMDCQMPGMDGFDATRHLRESGCQTPVVACTANASEEVYRRCLGAGMNDFVAKPVSVDGLQAVLAKWCGAGRSAPGETQA